MSIIKTGDGSCTLMSERYGETFHSTHGATTESKHVYLEAGGVRQRLEAGEPTRVLEIGFGLGLNTLLTADAALTHGAPLEFHTIEHDLSVCQAIQQLRYEEQLQHPELASTLQSNLHTALVEYKESKQENQQPNSCTHLRGCKSKEVSTAFSPENLQGRTSYIKLADNIHLTIHWCDASTMTLPEAYFDAIYLDAFSPDSNPECWTTSFFTQLRQALVHKTGRLSTYSAKGNVRRALLTAGFTVSKLPGPPGKREIIVARPNIDE